MSGAMQKCVVVAVGLFFAACAAQAQISASYSLTEHSVSAGGGSASSAGYTVRTSSITNGGSRVGLGGASYGMDGGFVVAYRPPSEVQGLLFDDAQTLRWDVDLAAVGYNLYRDSLAGLQGLGYGNCFLQDLPSATATDADVPVLGDGYFYLATSVDRLAEEGGKGTDGAGTPRGGTTCP